MSYTSSDVIIRPARAEDCAFLLQAVERLPEFGPPIWRTPAELVAGEARAVRGYFASPPPGTTVFVATTGDDAPLGFVFLERIRDYFTEEEHGHVGIIAVAAHAEGRGVAGALMRAAEQWAQAAGFRKLTLTVFEGNRRARAVYEHLGYQVETLRYVKLLERA
jgi:RimJ/RimL family protein N-acetyltransferase